MFDFLFTSIGIILMTLGLMLLVCFYGLARNAWVYKQRITLLEKDYNKYKRLKPYGEMLQGPGFWRWDVNYFIDS